MKPYMIFFNLANDPFFSYIKENLDGLFTFLVQTCADNNRAVNR